MKKLLCTILALCLCVTLLAGCGNSGGGSGSDEVVVTVGISMDFSDMSPFGGQSGGKQYYKWLIYGYLCLTDVNQVYHNVLAKEMTHVDDVTLDVEIYGYIHDNDGNAISADDVIYSFQMAKDSGNFTGQGPFYIDHMEKLGDYTVRFVFTQPTLAGLESYISNVPITSQVAYEASDDNMAVHIKGCGRYEISEFVSGSTLVLTKVQDFWQDEALYYELDQMAGNADKIIYKYIPEAATMSINLETGLIDVAGSVGGTEIDRFMNTDNTPVDGYNLGIMHPTMFTCLLFNGSEGGLFDNQALRQAVCYAIDTEGIVSAVLGGRGYACVTYGSSKFVDVPDTWTVADYYESNIEKARELVKEAGLDPDGSTHVRLVLDGNAIRGRAAQIIQGQLAQIGLDVEILAYETALFNTYKNDPNEWDILIDTKNGSTFVANAWRTSFDARSNENGLTVNFVGDPHLQELVEVVQSVDGHSEASVQEFHDYLKDQAYGYGLYVAYDYAVGVDTITDIFVNSSNYICPGAFTYSSDFVGVADNQ